MGSSVGRMLGGSRRQFLQGVTLAGVGVASACTTPANGTPAGEGGNPHRVNPPAPDAGDNARDAGQADAAALQDAGEKDAATQEQDDAGVAEAASLDAMAASTQFVLGVASGDAVEDRVMLWTRYDGTRPLRVLVAHVRLGVEQPPLELDAFAQDGGFTKVDVTGLLPGETYRYCFVEQLDGEERRRSNVGRLRMPVAADFMGPLVFGATSCTDNSKPFDTLQAASRRNDLAAFLFLGDTAYCEDCQSREDYRRYWVMHTEKDAHVALRASTSILATWDDHEVDNDWNPETFDPQRLAQARAAFFENLPLRENSANPGRLWKSVRWGLTAEIFVLDCRGERRPSTRLGPGATYVSAEQLAWLKDGLLRSPCTFKLIMNSVPISNMPPLFDFYRVDRWEGYPAQRTQLLSFMDDNQIGGVLWLAGDFHLASMGRVATEGPGSTQVEVLVGPGAQTPSPLVGLLRPPQFDWSSGDNNYTALHLDPLTRQVRVVYHGGQDQILQERTYRL